MWIALAIVGGPIAFLLLVWVIVTAVRLWRPEQPIPLQQDPVVKRRYRIRAGEPVLLHFEDIRDIERERKTVMTGSGLNDGEDVYGPDWTSDLDLRRN